MVERQVGRQFASRQAPLEGVNMFHLLDAINHAAKVHLPTTAPRLAEQGRLEAIQPIPERPTLDLLIAVLSDVFGGMSQETTASRRGVTTAFIRSIFDGLIPALSRVLGETIPDANLLTDAQALAIALSICDHINIKFSRLSEPRWKHTQKLAGNCDDVELGALTSAWLDLARFGNISTPPLPATIDFIRGLHSIGIPVHRIAIRINPNPKEDHAFIARSTNFLKQHFHLHFGAAPQFDRNRPRRGQTGRHGRQRMYLQVLTRPLKPGEVAPPALNDTQTLSAFLLAALVYSNMKPKK